ncbi:Zinc finger, CCCH-type [Corchorus capsularis]|uniref:Zinc finger, CCCH-type n=1 Tax=Corchorus capsularis TaxID=210143 RepID=A0A1R3G629_COCAP|nr:Zinc finger, CCCH-type [Corchorus capsularis]
MPLYISKPVDASVEMEDLMTVAYTQGTPKTELCTNCQTSGRCAFGKRCKFAHGRERLRLVIHNNRYKSRLGISYDILSEIVDIGEIYQLSILSFSSPFAGLQHRFNPNKMGW